MSVTSAGAPTLSVPRSRPSRRAGSSVNISITRASGDGFLLVDEDVEEKAELRLEAEDAERRLVELDFLFVAAMRRVIAGQHGDRAVGDACDERVHVALRCAAAGSF